MRPGRLSALLLIAAFATALSWRAASAVPSATPAPAAPSQSGTRVAVVNPSRIFMQMKERSALFDKLKSEEQQLKAVAASKQDEIKLMIEDRKQYNPENAQFAAISQKIDDAKFEYQAWEQKTKAQAERQQKVMMKSLYDKIEAAVAQVAQQNGIDLVIADFWKPIPNDQLEEIPAANLNQILTGRTVIYNTKAIDISENVIIVLDRDFAKNPAPTQPPGPSVTPGPPPVPTPPSK